MQGSNTSLVSDSRPRPIDAVQRMLRVTAETEMAKSGGHGMQDVRTETNFAARKF